MAKRLEIVENARRALADWPASHYNYRSAEVLQMLQMLDEAIADLRAASGAERFALNFSAFVQLPPIREPLLPPPTAQDTLQQMLIVAQLSDSAEERKVALSSALSAFDRDAAALPAEWVRTMRAATRAQLDLEIGRDRAYRGLSQRMLALARERAKAADVRGSQQLLNRIQQQDAALGQKRPEMPSWPW